MKKLTFIIGVLGVLLTTSLYAQTPDFNLPTPPSIPPKFSQKPPPASTPDPRFDPKINTLFMAHCLGVSPQTLTDQASIIIAVAYCRGYVSAIILTHAADSEMFSMLLREKNLHMQVEFTKAFCVSSSEFNDDIWKNVMVWVNENKDVAFSVPAFVTIILALSEKYPCPRP